MDEPVQDQTPRPAGRFSFRHPAVKLVASTLATIGALELEPIPSHPNPDAFAFECLDDVLADIDEDLANDEERDAAIATLRAELEGYAPRLARYTQALTRIAEQDASWKSSSQVLATAALQADALPLGYPPAFQNSDLERLEAYMRQSVPVSPETGLRLIATAIKERRIRVAADERSNASAEREARVMIERDALREEVATLRKISEEAVAGFERTQGELGIERQRRQEAEAARNWFHGQIDSIQKIINGEGDE